MFWKLENLVHVYHGHGNRIRVVEPQLDTHLYYAEAKMFCNFSNLMRGELLVKSTLVIYIHSLPMEVKVLQIQFLFNLSTY